MELAIYLAVFSMIVWGTSEIFTKRVVGKVGVYRSLLFIHIFSISFLLGIIMITKGTIDLPSNPLIFIAALLSISGHIFYYRAIKHGTLSVASPIGHSYGLIIIILGVLITREVLTGLQIVSSVIIVIGIIMISTKISDLKKLKIIRGKCAVNSLIAMVCWGLSLYIIAIITELFNFILIVLWFRVIALLFLLFVKLIKGNPLTNITKYTKKFWFTIKKGYKTPYWEVWLFAFLSAIFSAFAFLSFAYSTSIGKVSIIGPITSASPVITLILARIFYKEKLESNQQIAVVLILLGIFALSF